METMTWEQLEEQIRQCSRCPLCRGINRKVPGQGDRSAPLMLIGEGPGYQEDQQGLAFVGPAGQLLTRMLLSMGMPRDRVYICNTVKCRPPENRTPEPGETEACLPFLRAQTALVRPRVILLLGATAARVTLDPNIRISRDRGVWHQRSGVWMLATYHPSALLRDPSKKREAWTDMDAVRDKLMELGLYPDLYGEKAGGEP